MQCGGGLTPPPRKNGYRASGPNVKLEVTIRAALLREGEVGLLSLPARIGPRDDEVSEAWINYHTDFGRDILGDLTRQEEIAVVLCDQRGTGVTLRSLNALRGDFAAFDAVLASMRPWSMAAFDAAREKEYARWPTMAALWEALENV